MFDEGEFAPPKINPVIRNELVMSSVKKPQGEILC